MGITGNRMMIKKTFWALIVMLPLLLKAQQPIINTIEPTSGQAGDQLLINGNNFTQNGRVFFGSIEADIISQSSNDIRVTIPASPPSSPLYYVDPTIGNLSQSQDFFSISFGGADLDNYQSNFNTTNELNAYDICLCDLNNDMRNDVIISHNNFNSSNNEISYYENQSTNGVLSLSAPININNTENNDGFIAVTCGDLDADGNPDLVFTTNDGTSAKHIFIYENISDGGISLNYRSELNLRLPNDGENNRVPRKLKLADIDLDGKLDIVVGNETDNTIHIFRNTSPSAGTYSFSEAFEVEVTGAETTGSIELADLNNDLLSDLVIVPFDRPNENIYILRNNSIPEQINFIQEAGIVTSDRRVNIEIGDLNNDGLNDIAVTADASNNIGDEKVAVFRNLSNDQDIVFGSALNIDVPSNNPWGIDLGDLNGDGLLDIAVACLSENVYIYENTSSTSLSFNNAIEISTPSNGRNIEIADLNGDAKPDISFTHRVTIDTEGELGVFTNNNCIIPEITPTTNDFSFCIGEPFTLFATNSALGTYNWAVNSGNGTSPGNTGSQNFAEFTINDGNEANISVTISQGNCSESVTQVFNLESGAVTSTPTITISNTGTICGGDDVELSTTSSFDSYLWTLPDGSTSTQVNLQLNQISAIHAGDYELKVQNSGNCFSPSAFINISVQEIPTLTIQNSGLDNFCSDEANNPTLFVPDLGYNYQWTRNNVTIEGETSNSLTVSETGQYALEISDSEGCTKSTEQYRLTRVQQPTATISGVSEICILEEGRFISRSTGDPQFNLVNRWEIIGPDNQIETTFSLLDTIYYVFGEVGSYSINLETGYSPDLVESCNDNTSFMVTVSEIPTISFSVSEGTTICAQDSILVSLLAPDNIVSYEWTFNGITSTNESVYAKTIPNETSVQVNVTIDTNVGCTVEDSITINNFITTLDITSPTQPIAQDTSDLKVFVLLEDNFIDFTASGGSNFRWEPNENFSDPEGTDIIFFPTKNRTRIALSGTDNNNCESITEAWVVLDNLRPKNTFSPNGDGRNDCWEILNIDTQGRGCKVKIFDARGRNILSIDQFNDGNCVWNGTFSGNDVPEGVYYYVLSCPDANQSQSGSILMAR